jgi:hypothetical protein
MMMSRRQVAATTGPCSSIGLYIYAVISGEPWALQVCGGDGDREPELINDDALLGRWSNPF